MTDESLIRHVHRALHHLYDPVELSLSPLAGWFGITRGDVPSALRRELLEGIAALKPGSRVPPESNAWRVYQVLCYRFEEQSSQEEVASQMAVSPRQVRRLEQTAIRALTSHLTAQHGLSEDTGPVPTDDPEPPAEHAQELDFLRKSYPRETTDVYSLVDSALKTVEGMLKAAAREIQLDLPPGLPPVRGQATTLRQVLLNLFLAAIRVRTQAVIALTGASREKQVWIDVTVESPETGDRPGEDIGEFLDLARRLAELSEGTLNFLPPTPYRILAVRLGLPIAEQIRVLFVDDNEDSLRLFARFLEGTRFLFSATRDPHRALALAEETGAQIIVLDIMLPDIDGWEMLGRIRTHPHLGGIPVVISTILPHESLAASLGAAGFLRKPVSREALLNTLTRLGENLPQD